MKIVLKIAGTMLIFLSAFSVVLAAAVNAPLQKNGTTESLQYLGDSLGIGLRTTGASLEYSATTTTGVAQIGWDSTQTKNLFNVQGTGKVGVGSSTPYAKLSIHANNGETNTTLFAIGSSTAVATTTLFTVDNQGNTTVGGNLTIQGTTASIGNFTANNVTTLGRFLFSGSSQIFGGANDGVVELTNSAANNFFRLQFGGITPSFPGLNVNTAAQAVSVGLADGSLGGKFGLGTSTPWGKFAINLNNGETNTNALIIASSTANSTTTLDVITNTGQLGVQMGNTVVFNPSSSIVAGGNILVNTSQQFGSASDGNARWTPTTSIGNNSLFSTLNNTIWTVQPGTELMRLTSTGSLGVGTSSPMAQLTVATLNGSTGAVQTLFAIASSTQQGATTTPFAVASSGWVVTSGTLPTTSSCGSTQNVSGNQTNGTVIFTGTLVTSCTVNFPLPVPTGTTLQCTESDNSLAATADISATTTSSVTFGLSTGLAAGAITWHCEASRNSNN